MKSLLQNFRKWFKRKSRNSRHLAVYCLTIAFRSFMVKLPISTARRLGARCGGLAFSVHGEERRKILNNLDLAYGDSMPKAEKLRLGRQVMRNAGKGVVELAFMSAGKAEQVRPYYRIEGKENITPILLSGQGVVGLTAHLGNWEMLGDVLVRGLPHDIGAVGRPLSNPWMNKIVFGMRQQAGAHNFPRGQSGRHYVRFLRKGNTLGLLGDIDTVTGDGIFVDFFGRPAWTQRGIAELTRLAKARIVTIFIRHDPQDAEKYVVQIGKPLPQPPADIDSELWIRTVTEGFTAEIEKVVREEPDLWMWMHQRWKHQPKDLEKIKRRRIRRQLREKRQGTG